MTQVMIKSVSKSATAGAFSHMTLGSDTEAKTAKMHTFDIYSTSVLPAYGNAKEANIRECFKKDASAASGGVAECMLENDIPNKMLVEQVDVANIQKGEYCKKFGAGAAANGTTDSQLCSDS